MINLSPFDHPEDFFWCTSMCTQKQKKLHNYLPEQIASSEDYHESQISYYVLSTSFGHYIWMMYRWKQLMKEITWRIALRSIKYLRIQDLEKKMTFSFLHASNHDTKRNNNHPKKFWLVHEFSFLGTKEMNEE